MHAPARFTESSALIAIITADYRRVMRLFKVLEDVAEYAAPHVRPATLDDTWARIADLLLRMADDIELRYSPPLAGRVTKEETGYCLAAPAEMRKAVGQVDAHRAGAEDWWLAVQDAATVTEASYRNIHGDAAGGQPSSATQFGSRAGRMAPVTQPAEYFWQ